MDTLSNERFVPSSTDTPAGSRHAVRDSLLLSATLRVNDESSTVRVRNLSEGGMMAEHPVYVAPGTAVDVELRGVGSVAGRIAWVADGRVGIAFHRPIDPMLARKPVGRRSGVTR